MSIVIDVYYKAPFDERKELQIQSCLTEFNGKVTHKDLPNGSHSDAICLTCEFTNRESAQFALEQMGIMTFHVEGPYEC